MKKVYGFGIGLDLIIGFFSGMVYFEVGDLDKFVEFFVLLYE